MGFLHKSLVKLIKNGKWGLVTELLKTEKGKRESARKDKDNFYPIHFACKQENLPLQVLNALLDAYPKASQQETSDGYLPLHLAAAYNTSVDIINRLVEAYPQGILHKTSDGYLPIHEASLNNLSVDVLRCLAEIFPEGLQQVNKYGQTPKDVAVSAARPETIISCLTKAEGHQITNDNDKGNVTTELTNPGCEQVSLVELITSMNLSQVMHRLTSEEGRKEASQKDEYDEYPIHVACKTKSIIPNFVIALLKAFPDGTKQQNKDGCLPLHFAAHHTSFVEIIRRLVKVYPNGLQQPDNAGGLPIHYAARFNTSFEVSNHLVDNYPGGLQQKLDGSLPIHLASRYSISSDIIKLFVEWYPEGLQQSDIDGYLPIHLASCYNASASVVELLVKHCSEGLKRPDKNENLPIQLAICHKNSAGIVKLLIEHYPEGLKHPDKNASLPIHLAICHKNSADAVKLLIEHYPEGLKHPDKNGNLPVHLAIHYKNSADVVKQLVEYHPAGLEHTNNDANLPIHLASRYKNSYNVDKHLVEGYPGGIKQRDKNLRLPIHLASSNGSSYEFLMSLIELYPEGLQQRDIDGWLPIHFAARDVFYKDIVAKGYPEGLQQQTNDGNLPIHLALIHFEDYGIEYELTSWVEKYPKGLRQKNNDGCLPIHVAASNSKVTAHAIRFLIACYPEGLRQLNNEGRTPKDVAVFENRTEEIIQCFAQEEYNLKKKDNKQVTSINKSINTESTFDSTTSHNLVELIKNKSWDSVVKQINSKEGGQETSLLNNCSVYPIHDACTHPDLPTYVMDALLKSYPDGIKQPSKDGWLPIHLAVFNNLSVGIVKQIIECYPKGLQERNSDGSFPIHLAARNNTSVDLLRHLVEAHPDGLQKYNDYGWLPIHFAACYNNSMDVIRIVAEGFPEGLKQEPFPSRHTPKTLAVCAARQKGVITYLARAEVQLNRHEKNCPKSFTKVSNCNSNDIDIIDLIGDSIINKKWDSVAELMRKEREKEAIPVAGKDGQFFMHRACKTKGLPIYVLNALYEAWTDIVQIPDPSGWLPIHCACARSTSLDVVNRLIELYPEGIKLQDKDGRLPIHRAAEYSFLPEIIDRLFELYPDGILLQDKYGDTPKGVAMSCIDKRPSNIVAALTRAEEQLKQTKNSWVSLFEDQTGKYVSPQQSRREQSQECFEDKHEVMVAKSGLSVKKTTKNNTTDLSKMFLLHDQNEIAPQPSSLICLIEQRKWDSVSQKLATAHGILEASCVCNDLYKQFPIHIVCSYTDTPLNIFQELSIAYPKALKESDKFGRLPIHLASTNYSSCDVISHLVEAYPEGLQKLDANGELPIHHAAQWNTSIEVIKLLTQAYPDGLHQPNKNGESPKDLATFWNKTSEIILFFTNISEQSNELTNHQQQKAITQKKSKTKFKKSIFENNIQNIVEEGTYKDDHLSDDQHILLDVFEGKTKTGHIPTISQNYLDACEKIKIGEGGNGVVFLAKDLVANLVFVIKEYHNVQSAEKEIEILSQFQHPYIVRLLAQTAITTTAVSSHVIITKCSLLLEYMPKGSLADVLSNQEERNKLSFIQRIRIASNITAALCYFHNLGEESSMKVFHRDVKSANICLDDDYTAKIIDCGISKVASNDATHVTNTSGLSIGSIGYKAPEYAMDPTQYNEKCEVFSLGIVFIELLTGNKTQGASHYNTFSLQKAKLYPGYLDATVRKNIEQDRSICPLVKKFCDMAILCISVIESQRPTLKAIQQAMNENLVALQSDLNIKSHTINFDNTQQQRCFMCKVEHGVITCCNKHFLCEQHFIDRVFRYFNSQSIPCILHDSCGKYFTDENICEVSLPLLVRHVDARTRASERAKESSLLPILKKMDSNVSEIKNITKETQQTIDKWSTKVLMGMLSLASGRVSCPTLFYLVPENNQPNVETTTRKKWWKNVGHKNWLLYFVCAHDRKPVCPPIEIRSPAKWLKTVAPALKLMLLMIQLTIKATTSLAFDLSVIPLPSGATHDDQLEGMMDFTNSLLGNEGAKIIDEKVVQWEMEGQISNCKESDLIQQFGPDMQQAFEAIATKAEQNAEWRNHMKQVSSKEGIVWVRNQYVSYYMGKL